MDEGWRYAQVEMEEGAEMTMHDGNKIREKR